MNYLSSGLLYVRIFGRRMKYGGIQGQRRLPEENNERLRCTSALLPDSSDLLFITGLWINEVPACARVAGLCRRNHENKQKKHINIERIVTCDRRTFHHESAFRSFIMDGRFVTFLPCSFVLVLGESLFGACFSVHPSIEGLCTGTRNRFRKHRTSRHDSSTRRLSNAVTTQGQITISQSIDRKVI